MTKCYYLNKNRKKALEHMKLALDIWQNDDATYKPAIDAREKWTKWNQVN